MLSTYAGKLKCSTHPLIEIRAYNEKYAPTCIVENWIFVEERTLDQSEAQFSLSPAHDWAIELWKGVKLMDEKKDDEAAFRLLAPTSHCNIPLHRYQGNAFFFNKQTTGMQPTFIDGSSAKIEPADVRRNGLLRVLEFTVAFIAEHEKIAAIQSNQQSPQDTALLDLANFRTHLVEKRMLAGRWALAQSKLEDEARIAKRKADHEG